MSYEMINHMVEMVQKGHDPCTVWESSLTFKLGSAVKINRSTTAVDKETGASVTIPEGSVVSIVGIGGGASGNDGVVETEEGKILVVPYQALGESALDEMITGHVVKVTLTKPLPQSALDWLAGGYTDYDVELPYKPLADSSSSLVFLMKGEDEDVVKSAVDSLKKLAGASFKSVADSNMMDWNKVE